jgi:hypothetical protein
MRSLRGVGTVPHQNERWTEEPLGASWTELLGSLPCRCDDLQRSRRVNAGHMWGCFSGAGEVEGARRQAGVDSSFFKSPTQRTVEHRACTAAAG